MKKAVSIIFLFWIVLLSDVFANTVNIDFFTRFNDEYLEKYILEALENNHELKQANYRTEQFRQNVRQQLAYELPSLSVSSNYLGAHFPRRDYNFFIKQNSYILPFQASYEPDFLLKNRDKTRSSKKMYEAMLQNKKGVYISLLTDVASGYVNILLFDYLLQKQREIIGNKAKNYDFNTRKFKYGIIDLVSLNNSNKDIETEKIIYENLLKQLKTTLYNFSVLIGESPYCALELKRGKLKDFEYQGTIPEAVSSDLIYERPDIVEIEKKLKSAKIDITVAKKDFFPSFNLNGAIVFDTAGMGNFFSWESSFAYLIAGLTQDIFKGGAKIANLKYKKARYMELFEEYKQADLNAFKEINNALNLIKQDKLSEKNSIVQINLETKNLKASNNKLKRGTISTMDYLNDKTALNQKEQLRAIAKASRLVDYFTLYKALGGQL